MVKFKDEYLAFIATQGVGKRDMVASSPDSYVSYLNSVSKLIGEDITPTNLKTEDDVINIAKTIVGKRAATTIDKYKSAMRQYVAMVISLPL